MKTSPSKVSLVARPKAERPVKPQHLAQRLFKTVPQDVAKMAVLVDEGRPKALRDFDQIPMHPKHLALQCYAVAPLLSGKRVVFVGDHDSTSLMIGLLSAAGTFEPPEEMLVLDFDARLLAFHEGFSKSHNFKHIHKVQLYNVFDAVPSDLVGRFDVFYTNPPYGASCKGESCLLFATRGSELCKPFGASGYVIMPNDSQRRWTLDAIYSVQREMILGGWAVSELINDLHGYALDDDPKLASASLGLHRTYSPSDSYPLRYAGRLVDPDEIPSFYGKTVSAPYPHLIHTDGRYDYEWPTSPQLPGHQLGLDFTR